MKMITEKAQLILLRLYEINSETTKSSLLKAVPNSYSLESNLKLLSKKGLVKIREEVIIRRTYFISLTERGRAVAIQLKKAEDMITGSPTLISSSDEVEKQFGEALESAAQAFSVKTYDDHCMMEERKTNEKITIIIGKDDKGIQKLMCKKDNSFICFHCRYSWTLPEVQAMYFRYVRSVWHS
ncbi:MAG: hypothetical protein QXU98_03155 [Candidatus Parvarchaeota archaeon]